MTKAPLWARAPYYLLGTRIPQRYSEWVEHDIARARWHLVVPRLRLWAVGLVVVWVWWTLAGRDGLFLPIAACLILSGIWLMRPGDGAAERRQELLFQQKKLPGLDRLVSYLNFLDSAQPSPDEPPPLPLEPAFDHQPSAHDATAAAQLTATCEVCGGTIQREDERWAHRDADWTLYSCPACGWQDATAMRCPDCGAADLVRYEREPVAAPRRFSAFRIYVSVLVVAIAIVLLTDDRSPLARLVH